MEIPDNILYKVIGFLRAKDAGFAQEILAEIQALTP